MPLQQEVPPGEGDQISCNSWVGGDWSTAPRRLLKEIPPPPVPKSLGNWRDRDYVAAHSTIEALVRAQYECGGEPIGDIHRLLVHEPKPIWANQDRMRLPEVHCSNVGTKKSTKRCCDPRKNCKGIVRTKAISHRPHSAVTPPPPRIPLAPALEMQAEDRAEPEQAHSRPRSPPEQIKYSGRTTDKLMDVGIDSEVAPYLHDRLSLLAAHAQAEEKPTCVWVIVECCMDCANHGKSLRHDERAYLARYLQLKDAVERMFPVGVCVELLVPRVATSDVCCIDLASAYGQCDRRCEADCFRGAGYSTNRQTPQQIAPVWRPSSSSPGPNPACEPRLDPRLKALQSGRTRVGSFEVYLCCSSSLILESGTSLITVAKVQGGPAALQACRRKDDFLGMCLASKMKSRAWPPADVVLGKLIAAMPLTNFKARVHTELGIPVSGIEITASHTQAIGHKPPRPNSARTKYEEIKMMPGTACLPIAGGRTNSEGNLEINLPVCRLVRLQACHNIYMRQQQDQELQISPWNTEVTFIADTVIQLWQVEEENELVVYCSSPQSSGAPTADLVPFRGSLTFFNENVVQPDESGYLAGPCDVFRDIELLHCDGWRSATVHGDLPEVHGLSRFVELGRLQVPKIEAALVTECCKSCINGASMFLDGSFIGTTCFENDRRLSYGARHGEHVVRAEHFLVPDGIKHPFNVIGTTTTTGLEVNLPLEKFRFVCVSKSQRSGKDNALGSNSADLWLVGGDLASWRANADPDVDVWLWEGQFRHRVPAINDGETWESIRVQGGVINSSDFHAVSQEEDVCIFSQALAFPSPSFEDDEWKPTLHPAGLRNGCAIAHLASSPFAPAMWLAQLSNSSTSKINEQKTGPNSSSQLNSSSQSLSLSSPRMGSKTLPRIVMTTKCCGCGFTDAQISINGEEARGFDELGRLRSGTLDAENRPSSACSTPRNWESRYGGFAAELTHIKVSKVPACLLPGNTSEYVMHSRHASKSDINLDVACLFWIYWLPPDEEVDTTYDDDSDADDSFNPEGTVSISGNVEHVPEEARPLNGVLACQGTQINLDGRSIGPWSLNPRSVSQGVDELCLLSDLILRPSPIFGYTFRPKDSSPFKDRCDDLGGCEMQRLAMSPVVVGFLKPERRKSC